MTLCISLIAFASKGQEYITPEGTLKKIEGEWQLVGESGSSKVDVSSIAIRKKDGVEQSQVEMLTSQLALTKDFASSTGWTYYNIPSEANYSTIVFTLLNQSSIVDLSLSIYYEMLASPNDPEYQNSNQWYIDKIDANLAWDETYGSSSVTIAVIDGGIDIGHEDIGQGNDSYNNLAAG